MKNVSLSLALLLCVLLSAIVFAAPPSAPVGLCIQTDGGSTQCATDQASSPTTPGSGQTGTTAPTGQAGLFPGTNLKFRPGIIIAGQENESPSAIESKWQALFTTNPNRKVSYRPPGIYGGIVRRLRWERFYTNSNIRPSNPLDHTDSGYDWSLLDSVFNLNCVQNEGALVFIGVMEVAYGSADNANAPNWLVNAPYNGVFVGTTGNASVVIPKYQRYSGPDLRGLTNVNSDQGPPIVDEYIYFQQAMRDHLIATGNINKVMGIGTSEFYGGDSSSDETDFYHGVGTRAKLLADLWEESQIPVYQGAIASGGIMGKVLSQYVDSSQFGLAHPDMKLDNTGSPPVSRFSINDVGQKDLRHLYQATEPNGYRANTYFASGVANPWNYSNVTVPQTASHIIWALSSPPKGVNKDSGLGQAGDDPPGIVPAHTVGLVWWGNNTHSLAEWHEALDTFGPPGTFAFPYLPPGYAP
jgi:hypothetical protein